MTVQTFASAAPTAEDVALAHARAQDAYRAIALLVVMETWATLTPNIDPLTWWFGGARDRIFEATALAQEMMASEAPDYLRDVTIVQGLDVDAPRINPSAFAGYASDGRELEDVLDYPIHHLMWRVRQGQGFREAYQAAADMLRRIVHTQVTDAGREADQVAVVGSTVAPGRIDPRDLEEHFFTTPGLAPAPARSRRKAAEILGIRKAERPAPLGWIRLLTPPSCGRCAILAGKWYGWNDGFARHPNCFPAGVVTSGPPIEAATRRWYEGELVIIRTASGKRLPATANHPILTARGWVPAKLLTPGDYVVGNLGANGAPREHQAPTLIEDRWGALDMARLAQVPTTTEDFHGDGGYSEVDVVAPNRLLRHRRDPAFAQPSAQVGFGSRPRSSLPLPRQRRLDQAPFAPGDPAAGSMCRGSLRLPHLGSEPCRSYQPSLRPPSQGDLLHLQAPTDDVAAHAVMLRQRVLALAVGVPGSDANVVHQDIASRWDAPPGPFTVQSRGAYASRGQDLLLRLASQVELDRVVETIRTEWSGHVYNLTSSEGWFNANGIVASNCDCRHVPATEAGAKDMLTDVNAYFQSLTEEEQDAYFGRDSAQAIRDGADAVAVVNARQQAGAVYTVDGVEYTTQGTTTRGSFGRSRRGKRAIRRMTPVSIYRQANGNRDEAIRLLREFGYIED